MTIRTGKIRTGFIVAILLAMWAAVSVPQYIRTVYSQQTLVQPTVFVTTGTTISWTAGTVNNGGHPVTIAVSTAALSANKNDCSSPSYAACNFVIASSGGSVSVTQLTATAVASGVTLLGIVETNGTTATSIVNPAQINTAKVFVQ